MAEEEGRKEKILGRRLLPPPDDESLGADQATGLAGPGGAENGGADRATGSAGPGDASRGGADQTAGLACPIGDLLGLAGHDNPRSGMGSSFATLGMVATATTSTLQAMGSTPAPQAQQAYFVFSDPPSMRHDRTIYCPFNSTGIGDFG